MLLSTINSCQSSDSESSFVSNGTGRDILAVIILLAMSLSFPVNLLWI